MVHVIIVPHAVDVIPEDVKDSWVQDDDIRTTDITFTLTTDVTQIFSTDAGDIKYYQVFAVASGSNSDIRSSKYNFSTISKLMWLYSIADVINDTSLSKSLHSYLIYAIK